MRSSKIGLRGLAVGIVATFASVAAMSTIPAAASAADFHDSETTSGNIAVGLRGGKGQFTVSAINLKYAFEAVSTEGGLIGVGTSSGSFVTLAFHGMSVEGENEVCEVEGGPGVSPGTVTTNPLTIELTGPETVTFKPAKGTVLFEMDTGGSECSVNEKNRYTGTFSAKLEQPTKKSSSHVLVIGLVPQKISFGAHEITLKTQPELFTLGSSLFWAE